MKRTVQSESTTETVWLYEDGHTELEWKPGTEHLQPAPPATRPLGLRHAVLAGAVGGAVVSVTFAALHAIL